MTRLADASAKSLTVDVASELTQDVRHAWARLAAAASPFLDPVWFHAAPWPGQPTLYVARVDGDVAGLLPAFWLREPPSHPFHDPRVALLGSNDAVWRSGAQSIYADATTADWFPIALSVSPYGYRAPAIADRGHNAAAVLAALVEAADADLAARGARAIVHYGLYDDDGDYLRVLDARAAHLVDAGAHCELTVPPSLDRHFRRLGQRGRRLRSRYRQALREPDSEWLTVTAGAGQPFEATLQTASADLFAARARAHGDADPPQRLYERALGAWPERRWLLACRSRGVVRSALLVFERSGVLYPKFFGSCVRGDYFTLVFPRLIELAIERGAHRIALGGGSHEAKLLRGARLRRLLAAVRFYDRQLEPRVAPALAAASRDRRDHFGRLALRFRADDVHPDGPEAAYHTEPSVTTRGTG